MMKKMMGLLLILFPLFTFSQGFVIKGNVTGIISGYASLEVINAPTNVASGEEEIPARVRIENGKFELKGNLSHPAVVKLKISTRELNIFLENLECSIDGNLSELNVASFKAGGYNSEFADFIDSKFSPEQYIRKYPEKNISGWLGYRYLEGTKARQCYDLFSPAVKKSYYAQLFEKRIIRSETSLIGKPAPSFTVTQPDGSQLTLAQFSGKMLVIDFWASWCAPCRRFIPTVKGLYEEYKPKGVEFLSISVDAQQHRWLEAVNEEKMPWWQGMAEKGFSLEGMRKYYLFDYIPHLVIIGSNGNVLSVLDGYNTGKLRSELERLTGNQ